MSTRFIRVLQKDIVTTPEEWKNGRPGKFIKLPDRAKKVYCVLSVVAFSSAGNAEGKWVKKGRRLDKDWFWTSHALLQQLTGLCQKTVQRGIRELKEAGLIDYFASKAQGQKCFFRITRLKYNGSNDKANNSESSTTKRGFSKKDVSRIWTIHKASRDDLLTPEEMEKVYEINRKAGLSQEPEEQKEDDIPF
jgi:hypothetical protein